MAFKSLRGSSGTFEPVRRLRPFLRPLSFTRHTPVSALPAQDPQAAVPLRAIDPVAPVGQGVGAFYPP